MFPLSQTQRPRMEARDLVFNVNVAKEHCLTHWERASAWCQLQAGRVVRNVGALRRSGGEAGCSLTK